MPRTAIDYSKTIIYKLVCRNLIVKNCYVGHTTNFSNRKRSHKQSCNKGHKECYVHRFINENGGWNNWDIIMIESYPCSNLYEAAARERHWIETLNADLNINSTPIGGSTSNEYRRKWASENREKTKEYCRKWYVKSKLQEDTNVFQILR